jgi:anti-sigma B factor antagonist
MNKELMSYTTRAVGNITVLDLEGEIDLYKSPELRTEFTKLIAKQVKSLVVNFQKVSYVDSSGLATLIDGYQKMRAYQGKFVLSALTKQVRNAMEIARLDKFFSIFDDEATAIASFQRTP